MATFQQRVESYIGSLSGSETDMLSVWLKEEARNFISVLPISHLYKFQQWVDAETNLASGRFLHKVRLDDGDGRTYEAKEVPYEKLDSYLYEDSLYYATNRSPVFAIENNLIKTAPENLVEGTDSKILYVPYPLPDYDDTTIAGYPKQLEDYIVFGSAIKALLKKIYTVINAVGNSTPTNKPTTPVFTYTTVDGTTIGSVSIDISVLSLPVYTPPTSGVSFVAANNLINTDAEDVELAQAELAHQNSRLNEYNLAISNASKEFEEAVVIYKTRVEEKFENARLLQQKLLNDASRFDSIELANAAKALETDIAEYMAKLQLYQAEIQNYQSQAAVVSSQIEKFIAQLMWLKELKLEVLQTYLGYVNQGKEK